MRKWLLCMGFIIFCTQNMCAEMVVQNPLKKTLQAGKSIRSAKNLIENQVRQTAKVSTTVTQMTLPIVNVKAVTPVSNGIPHHQPIDIHPLVTSPTTIQALPIPTFSVDEDELRNLLDELRIKVMQVKEKMNVETIENEVIIIAFIMSNQTSVNIDYAA